MNSEREAVLQVVSASTGGERGYYRIPVDDANKLVKDGTTTLWCAYVVRDGETLVTAITGDGPDSEANAKFFAGARGCVLALIEDLERADRIIRDMLLEGANGRAAAEARERLGIPYEPRKHA